VTIGRNLFLLLIILSIIWPSYVVIVVGPIGINPTRIVLLMLLMVWVVSYFSFKDLRRHLSVIYKQNKKLILLMVAFFLMGIVSAILGSENKAVSLSAAIIQILYFPVFMLFAVSYLRCVRHIILFTIVVFISLLITEAIALVEFMKGGSFFAQYVDAASKTAENILEGKTRDDRFRVSSTFSNALSFAEFLVLLFPITLYVFMQAKKKIYQILAASQLVLIPICMWLTSSRSGIALIFLALIWVLWVKSERIIRSQRILLLLITMFSSLILGVFLGLDRVLIDMLFGVGETTGSSFARFLQLRYGIPAALSSPLYGYGIHQGAEQIPFLHAIDNYYLTVALEKGVTGLVLLLLLQGSMYVLLKKAYALDYRYNARQSVYQYLIISFVCVFIFELIVSLTDVFSMMYILLGITMVMVNLRGLEKRIKNEF